MAWSIKNPESAGVNLPTLPAKHVMLGLTEGRWFETEPGVAFIQTVGGTVDDRWLLEGLMKARLASVGIRQATYSMDPTPDFQKTAHWTDIMAKAKRLIQSGNVQLLRNGYNNIVAHVVGDHGEYTAEISRDDPNSRAITQWTCECPWDQYAFQRTRQWKKYEARPCAHVLAAFWKSLSTPLDEDLTPSQADGMGTGQALPGGGGQGGPQAQPSPMGGPFDGGTFNPDGSQQLDPSQPPMMPGMGAPTPLAAPGYDPSQAAPPPQMMAPPGQQSIIPPFPMDQSQMQMPVSVPGGRPGPYPANPLQQGGTLSHVIHVGKASDEFLPDTSARVEEDTMGKSEGREGATDAGQWMDIPKGTNVVVVHQDKTTGWVECLMPLKGGAMTSYHVRFFIEPEKLTPLNRPYTPFQNPK